MDRKTGELILLNGEPRTQQIESISRSGPETFSIRFKNGTRTYSYGSGKVSLLTGPRRIRPDLCKVYHNGVLQTGISDIWRFSMDSRTYWRIKFRNGYTAEYNGNQIKTVMSCLDDRTAENVFAYLREVATLNPLGKNNDEEAGILEQMYGSLLFIDERTAAACYLNPDKHPAARLDHGNLIFPFGCNASQKKAVETAFSRQISVIQGPPGTGKTQTILNIVANIVRNGQTVMVVSGNNSATANVKEKMEKYGLDFIIAGLGKKDNKESFLKCQPPVPEDILSRTSGRRDTGRMEKETESVLQKLDAVFSLQASLARLKQEQEDMALEWKHFSMEKGSYGEGGRRKASSSDIIRLWIQCRLISEDREYGNTGLLKKLADRIRMLMIRIVCRYRLGIEHERYVPGHLYPLFTKLQALFYRYRSREIEKQIAAAEKGLASYDADRLLEILSDNSMTLFKDFLSEKYGSLPDIRFQSIDDMKGKGEEFIRRYPVVLSTTFSATTCLFTDRPYDYIIMDESSQIPVETGTLALSCARNAVIVGDDMQLPNVITGKTRASLAAITGKYRVDKGYDCSSNSFLKSVCTIVKDVPQTLLREHYRCHPRIINFCSRKFYGGNLLIMTEDKGEKDVLSAIRTVKGNHAAGRYNQREIDVVKEEVLPGLKEFGSIGIVTPYNRQADEFRKQLPGTDSATVHMYQGREKDAIIMSVVDNRISSFADDPSMLNVAVSRARKKFCLVVTGNRQTRQGNITDLLDYIEYNNCSITDSKITSIFDILYRQYTEQLTAYLEKHPKISRYPSENLTYGLICDIISSDIRFSCLKIKREYPLRDLIKDTSLMSEEETLYASREGTHIDFLISNTVSMKPVLAVETDGYSYHNCSGEQIRRDRMKDHLLQTYGIPLVRLSTKGSGEKEKIVSRLMELMHIGNP